MYYQKGYNGIFIYLSAFVQGYYPYDLALLDISTIVQIKLWHVSDTASTMTI